MTDKDFARKIAKEASELAAEMMLMFMKLQANKAASVVACAKVLAISGIELIPLQGLVEAAYHDMAEGRKLIKLLERVSLDPDVSSKEAVDKIIKDLMAKPNA